MVKEKNGRRDRYHIQAHLPLPESAARERTAGEVLGLLTGTDVTVTGQPTGAAGREYSWLGRRTTTVWVAARH